MLEWFISQEGIIIYLIISLALLAGALGLPIPEDIPLIASGVLIHKGLANPYILIPICYIITVLGDYFIYSIGSALGDKLFQVNWFKKRYPTKRIKRVSLRLEKNSFLMIFIARHLFWLRTPTFLMCGAVKMKRKSFLISDSIAALFSNIIMINLGYFGTQHYETIKPYLKTSSYVIGIIFIYVFYRIIKKKK